MTARLDRPAFDEARQLRAVERAIARHSFCVLATSSSANRPHAVGILYSAAAGSNLYLLIGSDTVKARNIRENPRVAISIPVRTFPMPPPMAVQYQATAELLAVDDPEITALLQAGRLKKITGLGALQAPGMVFVRVRPVRRIASYGIGMSPSASCVT